MVSLKIINILKSKQTTCITQDTVGGEFFLDTQQHIHDNLGEQNGVQQQHQNP